MHNCADHFTLRDSCFTVIVMSKNNSLMSITNLMSALVLMGAASLGACSSDPLEAGAGDSVGEGTATLLVEGSARAEPLTGNAAAPEQYKTDFNLRISRAGVPLTTGTMVVSSLGGKVTLNYDSQRDGGRWVGSQPGYYEVYQFDIVDGADEVTNVRVDGPDIHTFTAPILGASVIATAPLQITWGRDEKSDSAYLDTKEVQKLQIPDEGSYLLPTGSLKSKKDQAENETISITRTNQVFPKGGAAGSTFEVRIVNSIDVLVAATGI